MLRQYANFFRRSQILADALLIVLAFAMAYYVRRNFVYGLFPYNIYFLKSYGWILPAVLIPWVVFMYFFGMYRSFRLKKIREVLWIIFKSGAWSFFLFSAISYFYKFNFTSRPFIGLFFIFAFLLLLIEKIAMMILFRQMRLGGFNFRNIMVVGTGRRAQNFIKYLNLHKELGLKIVALVDDDPANVGNEVLGYKVIGSVHDVPKILREVVIDYAVFIVPRNSLGKIEDALIQCELVGVSTSVAMDLFNLKSTTAKETNMLGIPMVTFERTPQSIGALLVKRAIDLTVATIGLFLISPIYLGLALAIKFGSPGPVYFTQERVGLNGRRFKLYKFRTMVIDAEAKLKDLMAFNQMKGHAFKMDNDPRITKIGKFLRKFSLDELPQLWNVFHGDMSLVGPRPPLPSEVKGYDAWHQRRLSMRPGITCIWQVSGRNRISDFDEWVKLDLQYIDNWSLVLDFKILLKTIPAVLSTSGAK